MEETTNLALEVASLSREVRRVRRTNRVLILLAGLGLASGLATGLARAAGTSGALEASRFVLRDASGAERAVLGFGPDGSVLLTFYRPDGSKALNLGERPQMIFLR